MSYLPEQGSMQSTEDYIKQLKELVTDAQNRIYRLEWASPSRISSFVPEDTLHLIPTPFFTNPSDVYSAPVYPQHMPESRWPHIHDKVARIKRVREATGGTGLKECKETLEALDWDVEEAIWRIQSGGLGEQ